MEGVKILKRPKLHNPYFIAAWPGMGEVAFKAVEFLVKKLNAQEFAYIKSKDFFYPTGSNVQEGMLHLPNLPYGKFYFWNNPLGKGGLSTEKTTVNKKDLIIFLSNAQPDLERSNDYSRRILATISNFDINMAVCFAAMPLPIDHTQEPGVWGCATDNKLKDLLINQGVKIMSEGQISGMNGLFLGMAKKYKINGICLLGEIPIYTIQIENPKAVYALLNKLNAILNMSLDIKELRKQADFVEGQINQLVDYLKLGSHQPPPIGDEEIEKIRNSLSQFSKLPDSVRQKIEVLFEKAKTDISKANQLKHELDRWNVYKEYEDKFLDLFKRAREKGN